jgi:hypothetical protein
VDYVVHNIIQDFLQKSTESREKKDGWSRGDVVRRIIRNNFEEEKPKIGDSSIPGNERGGLLETEGQA